MIRSPSFIKGMKWTFYRCGLWPTEGPDYLLLKHLCALHSTSTGHQVSEEIVTTLPILEAAGATELCPACRVEIPQLEISSATCASGHNWRKLRTNIDDIISESHLARCALTMQIISSPYARSCMFCSRKYLPSCQSLHARGIGQQRAEFNFTELLLQSIWNCIYCGSQLISILWISWASRETGAGKS